MRLNGHDFLANIVFTCIFLSSKARKGQISDSFIISSRVVQRKETW